MGVDTTFVFPVSQTTGENLGEARKKTLNVLMMNADFASLIKSRYLAPPPDLEGVKYPPSTESFLIISCDHRFLSPDAPRDERSMLRWEKLKEVMNVIVDASRLSHDIAPWYSDDLTVFDTSHDLVLSASKNRVNFINDEFIDFMDRTFGPNSKQSGFFNLGLKR